MTNEQIVENLAALPLIVRSSQDEVFKAVRELQEAARQVSVSLLDSDSQVAEPDYRQLARELAMIVDVGTNDDPGTALAKLRKIQHVATTSMRDKCVDAIKSLRATPHGAAYNNAVNDAIRKCESLTLDPLEPEK